MVIDDKLPWRVILRVHSFWLLATVLMTLVVYLGGEGMGGGTARLMERMAELHATQTLAAPAQGLPRYTARFFKDRRFRVEEG